jgi:MFS family permease
MPALSFLHRDHSIAPPGFNRWRVPPSALAIHLAVGQAYAFSVFNLPLTRQLGITAPAPGDWSLASVAWVFSTAIVFLGLSAALFGKWLERVGPRAAMFASALCFSSGFWVAALGVTLHQFWLLVLGYGVLGGVGLGIGYISPVSTLIKWFPDRPGMATGLAIMGFGGGAMIGSPLGVNLMKRFAGPHSTGVAPAFVTMGVLYLAFMMFGVFTVRLPATAAAAAPAADAPPAQRDHTVDEAFRAPQFWLLWLVLFVNVTAGIGILSQASPMIQEIFPRAVSPAAAAGFVGLLSLFNLAGRFGWSSLSDFLGRKRTYCVYFLLGIALYAAIPLTGKLGSVPLFVGCCAVIMSMYGGGFSTIPAYLRDLFGTSQVGAIHGRLLTAWSAAGVAGPLLISSLREYQRQHGVPSTEAYSMTMYLLAGLLGIGLISNLLVRPAAADVSAASGTARARSISEKPAPPAGVTPALLLGWLVVGMPLAWGIWETFKKSLALFH